MPSSKSTNGSSAAQVSHRLRNFFRMNSAASSAASDKDKTSSSSNVASASPGTAAGGAGGSDMPGPKPFRHTKFFSNTVGRLRAHTVASEGNQLEEALSPTAHANPYFAHQGQPGLRHHNEGSVPPSPPDTPQLKISGPDGAPGEQATSETKEELARRLRRVASAPNAQGLFTKDEGKGEPNGDRPATAEFGKDPLVENVESGSIGLVEKKVEAAKNKSLGPPGEDILAALPAPHTALAFRRTYSSNSIKVRNVEVSPSSFDKIKLIGKGDVGKVYLVREKKSSRLYAMKGRAPLLGHELLAALLMLTPFSLEQEGNDQAQQDQASACRAGDPGHEQPSVHCDPISLVPVRRSSLSVYGILQWWRVLPSPPDSSGQVHPRRRRPLLRRRGDGGARVSPLDGLHLPRPQT